MDKKKTISLITVLIAIGAVAIFYFGFPTSIIAPEPEEQTVCTMDAMQCPDGSWVGRTGPNCEFVCPASE